MNKKKLLQKIINNRNNVKFSDFTNLVTAFGFFTERIEGSYHIYKNSDIKEIINLQNVNGEAKPYQIKQFLALVEKYNLEMEEK